MPRRPNPTIGMVRDAHSTEEPQPWAAVRRDRSGALYYVAGGTRRPMYAAEYILEAAIIWGESGTPPEDAPLWIKRGLAYPPGSRGPDNRPRAPSPAGDQEPSTELDVDAGAADPEPSTDAGELVTVAELEHAPEPSTDLEPAPAQLEKTGNRPELRARGEPGRLRGGLFR
jgi:hypothetical protein